MNPNNFLLSTDYPLDKAIYLGTQTKNLDTGDIVFAHGLPFTPLIKIFWSLSSDFSTVYQKNGPETNLTNVPFTPYPAYVYADATNVHILWGGVYATYTVYVRIYAFMPSNVNVQMPPTASAADSMTLNTDYNYTKLYMANVTASSSTPGSSVTVNHNLDYYPQVEVWYTNSTGTHMLDGVVTSGGATLEEAVQVTTSSITMYRSSSLSGSEYFHYRIYADEL